MKNEDKLATLALNGGAKAISTPLPPMFPGIMNIDEEEEEAVLDVLRRRELSPHLGPSRVAALEAAFAAHVGSAYSVAVVSGTEALKRAINGLGIGPGDAVILPSYTWITPALAVIEAGAEPVLAEVDDSLTIDPADVSRKITSQ